MLLSTPPFDPNFTARSFSLVDVVSGEKLDFDPAKSNEPFVIAFICNHCPYVIALIDKFVKIADSLKEHGIETYAVMSNNYALYSADNPENMKVFAEKYKFGFPYLIDEDQLEARYYGAVCTPDFFSFGADGKMQYRGSIDGLENTMLELKEHGQTSAVQVPSQGCSIKWK